MKQTISQNDFIDAFERMGRGKQFSYDGLCALFDYLEEMEQDTGEEMELDVIALCCDYSEYDSAVDALKDLNIDLEREEDEDDDDYEERAVEELENNTTVIKTDSDGVIIQNY